MRIVELLWPWGSNNNSLSFLKKLMKRESISDQQVEL